MASHRHIALALVLPLGALLSFGSIGYLFRRRLIALISAPDLAANNSKVIVAENPWEEAFFREVQDAQTPTHEVALTRAVDLQTSKDETCAGHDPLQKFFTSAPAQLVNLRRLFSDISRADDKETCRKTLAEFLKLVKGVKDSASQVPELHPAWLMACTLEGLLKQLAYNPAQITSTILGTAAGAVDALENLCVPGQDPHLATDPPIRLLAVDDDPISHLAITYALKSGFRPPDVASDGKAALALTASQRYDVIFLDIDMPGMDGFELCTRIHQTEYNSQTPVVFVTQYNDINARARSALSGGESLIEKPFLAFEIAVKALTLALRGRLRNSSVENRSPSEQVDTRTQASNASEELTELLRQLSKWEEELPTEWRSRTSTEDNPTPQDHHLQTSSVSSH